MEGIITTKKQKQKNKLKIEDKEETNNKIMFSFGNEYFYTPDTFKIPCPIYWNSHIVLNLDMNCD